MHKNRHITDKIIYTHFFMWYTAYMIHMNRIDEIDTIIAILYAFATATSFAYHYTHERCYIRFEANVTTFVFIICFIRQYIINGIIHIISGFIILIPGFYIYYIGFQSAILYESYHYLFHVFSCLATLYGYSDFGINITKSIQLW